VIANRGVRMTVQYAVSRSQCQGVAETQLRRLGRNTDNTTKVAVCGIYDRNGVAFGKNQTVGT